MKKRLSLLLFLVSCIIIPGIFVKLATAQVTSDGTTNTTVDANGNDFTIQDGDRAGNNLFHSFQDFSVPTDGSTFFDNAPDIANILSRVTGGNISNIDGLIRANGSANLFLINPAGIIFGQGARLDLGGSFYGSSATSILFEDGEFSAADLENPSLLTINAPIGLGFRDNLGEIINRSLVQNSSGEFVGLEVLPGNNLALIGGNINFETGFATARGGNIELGGLSEAGTVGINPDGSLSFPEEVTKADINLSNGADVDATGTGGGSVSINARNLNLSAGEFGSSFISAGIRAESTSAEAQPGDVTIDVAENITLDDSGIFNQVDTAGVGNSGNITINTGSIEAINGGIVDASTFGQGNAGSINITATGDLTFDGEDSNGNPSGATSAVASGAEGDVGGVTISTANLTLTNGGRVDASTFGQGNAGSININATGDLIFDGEGSEGFPSGVASFVNPDAVGDAGGVTISTANLTLTNGGRVSASTLGQGDAGNVAINAAESIFISGVNVEGDTRSGLFANALISDGNGGNVNVATDQLTIANGSTIDVGNFDDLDDSEPGTGEPGNIDIEANNLDLLATARINAATQSETGGGGNITLQIAEDITLRDDSFISAQAFGDDNEGNIDIDTRFLIAFPSEPNGNDILAFAEAGSGGNIDITSQAIFGLAEGLATDNNGTNDIDVSGEFNFTQIATEIGSTEVGEAPNNLVESEETVAQACKSDRISGKSSSLTIQGKGGIPPQPIEPIDSDAILVNGKTTTPKPKVQSLDIPPLGTNMGNILAELIKPIDSDAIPLQGKTTTPKAKVQSLDIKPIKTSMGDILPAKGVIKTEDGQVILTAYSTDKIDTRTPHVSPNCMSNFFFFFFFF